MQDKEFEQAMARALSTLRQVKERLAHGVDKAEFERDFRGRFVSPGVSVPSFIRQLRMSGSLEETDSWMKLRESVVPLAR